MNRLTSEILRNAKIWTWTYPQNHVGSGNVTQFVYAKRMALQGNKKNCHFFRVHLTSDHQLRTLVK
jgi:hypothetical protein